MADPSGTTRYPTVAATSAATAPYDDDDWLTPDNAKADDAAAAISHYTDTNTATTGVNDTVVTVASGGTIDWDTKTGVNASGGSAATITNSGFDTNVISYLAKGQGLGFAVPSNATILGVVVMVRKNRTAGTTAVDYTIQLLDSSGALFGSNKADTATNWPASFSNINYGGAADMWGLTTAQLTPTVVNNANFGVGVQAQAKSNNVDIGVDQITITVYYRLPDLDNTQYSYLLKLTNFAWDIPVGATIDGIKVEIERQGVGTVKDAIVKLLDASGAPVGDSKADTVNAWPSTYGVATYGGAADTWNATPTQAMVNDVDFGVEIAILSSANVSDGQIDYVRMTIYYTAAATYTLTAATATLTINGYILLDDVDSELTDSADVLLGAIEPPTNLKLAAKVIGDQASVAITGIATNLLIPANYTLTAAMSAVDITGVAANLNVAKVYSLTADMATVAITGIAATLSVTVNYALTADMAAVAITGIDVSLLVSANYSLTADAAVVSIAEQGVTFTKVLTMVAAQASMGLTGQVTHLPNIAQKWWESGSIVGLNVYAYQALNIDSLASSYKNLHDHNDHALTLGVAPSWVQGTGWTYTGTQYLKTGLIPAGAWATLARFSNAGVSSGQLYGCTTSTNYLYIFPRSPLHVYYANGTGFTSVDPPLSSGVLGIAYTKAYRNGVVDGNVSGNLSVAHDIYIGGRNSDGTFTSPFSGNVIAFIAFDGTIHEEQAYSIYAAMLLLEHRPLLLGEQASIAITDQGVTFTKAVTLTADTATVSITGIDAALAVAKSYSLTADSVTVSITGQTTGLLSALKLTAAQASVAITDQGATLKIALKLIADQATVSITDQGATLRVAYTYKLTADQATVSITEQGATFKVTVAYKLVADQASVAITGQTAALNSALKLAAVQASVAITGQDATLSYHNELQPYTLTADQASVSITGIAATFKITIAYTLVADQATVSISGQTAALKSALKLTASQASILITGQDTTLTYYNEIQPFTLTADQAIISITGQTATLKSALKLIATQGNVSITGIDAGLTVETAGHFSISCTTANVTITGESVNLKIALHLIAAYNTVAITGITANLLKGLRLTAQQSPVALTPQTALLKSALRMTAAQGSLLIADNPVAFILACSLAATYGVVNISGIPANLVYSSITGDLMGAKNYHTPSFGFRNMRG